MASEIKLSDALAALLDCFEPHVEIFDGVSLTQENVMAIVFRLRLLVKLASAMEQEVHVHRLVEIARNARLNMEDLSTEALTHLILDPEGKVIKPDFGRKS